MPPSIIIRAGIFATYLSAAMLGQVAAGREAQGSLYQINFQPGDPVPGVGAMPAVRLPLECTGDGTMFITMVQAMGTGAPPRNLSVYSPSLLLTSISKSGEAHSFPLDQVPDLYDVIQVGDYVSDSKVVFLVNAAHGAKPQTESADNATKKRPERHSYIVLFDRQGNYDKTIEIEDEFHVTLLGLFPSGMFLAYGMDRTDHSPKLAMLKDDGRILKFLELSKGDAPESATGTKDASNKGPSVYVAPAQFAGQGHFIYLAQNKTSYPLLEINEAGGIRAIKPKRPSATEIETIVPSDEGLYVRLKDVRDGAIYELNSQDGSVLRRFRVGESESGADVACVHDRKFLSFEHSSGRLVPLIGTAELANAAAASSQKK
jgi:hypothetical protein